jgi:hypothetical protein
VKSVSCPTAEITGISDAATRSRQPFIIERRQIFRRPSAAPHDNHFHAAAFGFSLKYRTPAATSAAAASPCTCAG